ncbi:hypothetical protein L484_009316 [Morus notabilis]|uniref:Uncharacterized protein n=1 Tax=Morus notabilis TaxID=981085 RepID=W9R359_9ROSA|nr:hypothetical protein L484_009316 [Morus notabilis]
MFLDTTRISEVENENVEAKFDSTKKIASINSKIPDNVIPNIDMKFETEEYTYNFYNDYARKVVMALNFPKEGFQGKPTRCLKWVELRRKAWPSPKTRWAKIGLGRA